VLHAEDPLPHHLVGLDPQKALAQHDEARNVHYSVGGQVVQLDSVGKEKASEEIVCGKGKSVEDKCQECYPKSRRWSWGHLWSWYSDLLDDPQV
jgi:hypothetical protein